METTSEIRHFIQAMGGSLRGLCLLICLICAPVARGQYVPASAAGVAKWSPAQKPTMVGPINVGIILILFPDTQLAGDIEEFKSNLDSIHGMTQEEYFKLYSNDIAWPVARIYPGEDPASIYHAPQCYGYYCKYDYWSDPIGWKSAEEGQKRAGMLRADALKNARARSPDSTFKALAYCFITTTPADRAHRQDLRRYYAAICGARPETYPDPAVFRDAAHASKAKSDLPGLTMGDKPFDPWAYYHPSVAWGEPMWPNSTIQFNNASAGTFAHEFGHVMGAPDIYRIGRPNDGIGGNPVLLAYGPTATAFSRFYHHGFVPEKNYPTINQSGTYTLYPRHIKPDGDEALGYIIPSRHPHYCYQIEYIYGENPAMVAGGGDEVQNRKEGEQFFSSSEGILISVIDLGESNYLGSPDGFYTYRPDDPWFRGLGNTSQCLFGSQFGRQEFNMTTEPSARLPNLLDGGVSFKNITEHQGTATFDVEIDKTPLPSTVFQSSLLPAVRLEPVDQILPTSFHMALTIKFRGEPRIDQYGMCWSTARTPQANYDHYTLANCNYNMDQGRALNLRPDTKYYVRGWASNAKGIRYSDEELEVKTPPLAADIEEVEPLLLDSFSNNDMLHDRFSQDFFDRYGTKEKDYESYAPTALLCKLAAYYHPDGLLAPHANVAPNPSRGDTLGPGHELMVDAHPEAGMSKTPVNFGRLHWDPRESDPSWRTVETLSLFEEMRNHARAAQMFNTTLTPGCLAAFNRMFKYKIQPQFQPVTSKTLDASVKLIKEELINARPVVVIESPKTQPAEGSRIQWGLIDGFRDGGNLHIDFPRDNDFVKEKSDRLKYATLDTLIVKDYDLAIVTHISF